MTNKGPFWKSPPRGRRQEEGGPEDSPPLLQGGEEAAAREGEQVGQQPLQEAARQNCPVPVGEAVFPGGSDLMNTSRISDLLGQEGPKTVHWTNLV